MSDKLNDGDGTHLKYPPRSSSRLRLVSIETNTETGLTLGIEPISLIGNSGSKKKTKEDVFRKKKNKKSDL